jgi:hypothetical protein
MQFPSRLVPLADKRNFRKCIMENQEPVDQLFPRSSQPCTPNRRKPEFRRVADQRMTFPSLPVAVAFGRCGERTNSLADKPLLPRHDPQSSKFESGAKNGKNSAAFTSIGRVRIAHRRVPLLGTSSAGAVRCDPRCLFQAKERRWSISPFDEKCGPMPLNGSPNRTPLLASLHFPPNRQ